MHHGSRLACGLALWLLAMAGGCRDARQSASGDLGDAGYAVSEADFFRAVRANDTEALKKFVRAGLDVNVVDAKGMGGLHQAAEVGAQDAAGWLLERKVPIDRPAADGRTALMVAADAGQDRMVVFLLRQGANPSLRDSQGFKPIMLAVAADKPRAVEALAPRSREDLDSAVLLAAALGRTQVVDVLTRYGASVYARMDDGRTALMLAAENDHRETAELLVELGANRFALGPGEQTAAQLAQANGHGEMAAWLSRSPASSEMALPDLTAEPAALAARAGVMRQPSADGNGAPSPPVASLDGAQLRAGAEPGGGQLRLRGYRESALPLSVQRVTGNRAQLRVLHGRGQPVEVAVGQPVPGTPFRVVRVERKLESSKLNQGRPTDVSMVEIEEVSSGRRRVLMVDHEASAHDPYAVLDEGGGRLLIAQPGQRFRTADATEWTVVDVRPTQIVLDRCDGQGSPVTLPLAGSNP